VITANVIEIEGLAMNGMLRRVSLVDCERPPGWRKIVVETLDGRTLETACLEPPTAKRNYAIITLYMKRWSSLINRGGEVEGPPEFEPEE